MLSMNASQHVVISSVSLLLAASLRDTVDFESSQPTSLIRLPTYSLFLKFQRHRNAIDSANNIGT